MADQACYPPTSSRRIMFGWLVLAVGAILVSLLYALILVVARSGYDGLLGGGQDNFRIALVLHVNFSLLVWFMAFAGMLWSWYCGEHWARLGRLGWWSALAGVMLVAVSPLLAHGAPIMSDYLPVLNQPIYFLGLGLFACGVGLTALRALLVVRKDAIWERLPLRMSLQGAAGVTLLALISLVVALARGSELLRETEYFGYLFWGSGHLLQSAHLLLMIFCLMWLGLQHGWWRRRLPDFSGSLILLVVLTALPGPLLNLFGEIGEGGRIAAFTRLMELAGGIGLVLIVLLMALRGPGGTTRSCGIDTAPLWVATLLFLVGALAGFLIQDNNAMVPAHYHGVIGAVTLVYMAMAYKQAALFGFLPAKARFICIQSLLYGSGVLLLMAGLIVSDVPRKTLSAETVELVQLILGRGLMAVGGGVAVVSSLLFVGAMLRSLFITSQPSANLRAGQVEGIDGK